jgi:hypothetical protein
VKGVYNMENERKNSEARIRANSKYNKAHTVGYSFRLNTKTDEDLINRLEAVPNIAGYIKQLIREDMKKNPRN